ncbi:MAG: GTP 3',8-cyclase MoaA [Candidatus Eisenbacteria sp.]|nr:GTP 3',8-cyclase MoaA [Candidatus Eisenbacteria bacterium]
MISLIDSHGRSINYLRISVTDRCNLRCYYCMPPQGVTPVRHSDVLRYEEIVEIARAALACGFTKFRLTGGEPLLRAGVLDLARDLARLPGLSSLTMTTNGTLLEKFARALREAGVQRLNVSLDALDSDLYRRITRGGDIRMVLRGIEAARSAGFEGTKINTVMIKGTNEDEIPAFVRYSAETGTQIRFIEKMPFPEIPGEGLTGAEVRQRIEQLVELSPEEDPSAPRVRAFTASNGGRFAFISPVTDSFCVSCNRLRLTSTGFLRQCLLCETGVDLRAIVRSGRDQAALRKAIREAVLLKPLTPQGTVESAMNQIGG